MTVGKSREAPGGWSGAESSYRKTGQFDKRISAGGGGGGDTADPPFFLRHWDSEWCWGKIHVFIAILEEKKTQGNWTRWFSAL